MAPRFHLERLLATLIAFGLAVGVGAHGLDELRDRPLRTHISSPVLATVSGAAIVGAVALGALGIAQVGWGLAAFVVTGVVLVIGYNLEIWGGRLHTSAIFALGWARSPRHRLLRASVHGPAGGCARRRLCLLAVPGAEGAER